MAGSTSHESYRTLGLRVGATCAEVRASFIKLARLSHPDKQHDSKANIQLDFKKIRYAYEHLMNELQSQVSHERASDILVSQVSSSIIALRLEGIATWCGALLEFACPLRQREEWKTWPRDAITALRSYLDATLKQVSSKAQPLAQRKVQRHDDALARRTKRINCVHRLHGGGFEAQVALNGFLVRWRGREWEHCVQAHVLLIEWKRIACQLQRQEPSKSVRDLVSATLRDISWKHFHGNPLPFWYSSCTTHSRKRFHAPWMANVEFGLKAYDELQKLRSEVFSETALQQWHNACVHLETAKKQNVSIESKRTVMLDLLRIVDDVKRQPVRRRIRGKRQMRSCRRRIVGKRKIEDIEEASEFAKKRKLRPAITDTAAAIPRSRQSLDLRGLLPSGRSGLLKRYPSCLESPSVTLALPASAKAEQDTCDIRSLALIASGHALHDPFPHIADAKRRFSRKWPAWLQRDSLTKVICRLRVVKAAWQCYKGPSPQHWFDLSGSKCEVFERILSGLAHFSKAGIPMLAGLAEAVQEEDFDFAECMDILGLEWDVALDPEVEFIGETRIRKLD